MLIGDDYLKVISGEEYDRQVKELVGRTAAEVLNGPLPWPQDPAYRFAQLKEHPIG